MNADGGRVRGPTQHGRATRLHHHLWQQHHLHLPSLTTSHQGPTSARDALWHGLLEQQQSSPAVSLDGLADRFFRLSLLLPHCCCCCCCCLWRKRTLQWGFDVFAFVCYPQRQHLCCRLCCCCYCYGGVFWSQLLHPWRWHQRHAVVEASQELCVCLLLLHTTPVSALQATAAARHCLAGSLTWQPRQRCALAASYPCLGQSLRQRLHRRCPSLSWPMHCYSSSGVALSSSWTKKSTSTVFYPEAMHPSQHLFWVRGTYNDSAIR